MFTNARYAICMHTPLQYETISFKKYDSMFKYTIFQINFGHGNLYDETKNSVERRSLRTPWFL